jgi:hypothetical protein
MQNFDRVMTASGQACAALPLVAKNIIAPRLCNSWLQQCSSDVVTSLQLLALNSDNA